MSFPACFQLVAAMNPCPDGFLGSAHPAQVCRCTPDQIARYRNRVSGPLMDRIDLRVTVAAIEARELHSAAPGESSARVRDRVQAAHDRQIARQGKPNGLLSVAEVSEHCVCEPHAQAILVKAAERYALSGRGQHRILRVARSIADLAGAARIGAAHMAEAIGYRTG
jgi:magnesium chelatase family protein